MAFQFFWFIRFPILLLLSTSSSSMLVVDSKVQGCSLVGIDLQNCLAPTTQQTLVSIGSCCTSLNLVLEAGYHCLCSLLGPSGSTYPVFSPQLALSFSNCYISVPPLTRCHEARPIVPAPPVAAMPLLNEPPPPPAPPLPPYNPFLPPVQKPPNLTGGEGFVPLPPEVNEMPLSEDSNSSIAHGDPIPNSRPLPMVGIPERWDYVKSDGAEVKVSVNSRNLLVLVSFLLYCI